MKLTGDRCLCHGSPYKGCGEYFNSTYAFDKHRTGSYPDGRRCRTAEEMFAIGMEKNAQGFWISSKRVDLTSAQGQTRRDLGDPLVP